METKQCTECLQTKPVSEFRKQSINKDGLKYFCKECDNKYHKEYYLNNKEYILEKKRLRYQVKKNK